MNSVDKLTNVKVYPVKLDFKVKLIEKLSSLNMNAAFEALHAA